MRAQGFNVVDACGPAPSTETAGVGELECIDPDQFAFVDAQHFNTVVHRLWAKKAAADLK